MCAGVLPFVSFEFSMEWCSLKGNTTSTAMPRHTTRFCFILFFVFACTQMKINQRTAVSYYSGVQFHHYQQPLSSSSSSTTINNTGSNEIFQTKWLVFHTLFVFALMCNIYDTSYAFPPARSLVRSEPRTRCV